MFSTKTPQHTVIAEKTMFDVLREMWRARFYITAMGVVAALAAFLFIRLSNDFYRAEMIIAPATHMGYMSDKGTMPDATGEGISQHGSEMYGNEAFTRFENTYSGTSVASYLFQDKEFLSNLSEDRLFKISKETDLKGIDAQKLSEYIGQRVKIEPVSGTYLRKLIYAHTDKGFAKEMLLRVHKIADEMIRVSVLSETNQRIDYLNKAISGTSNPDHKRALASLLLEQERIKMMVSIEQPYAAYVVEPAYVLSRTYWPDPYVFYPLFVVTGMLLGYLLFGLIRAK